MASPQDAWKINGEDRAKHDAQFFQLKPVNGFVSGTQARDFFMQSGLATQVLGQIWSLADMNGDGKMDKKEFSVAMHLIKKKLQGYELPKTLPASLKADPTPMVGSFGQPPMGAPTGMNIGIPGAMGGGMSMPGAMPMMAPPQASLGTATMTTGSMGMPRMANGTMTVPPASMGVMPMGTGVPLPAGATQVGPASTAGLSWAIPHNNRLKYTQTFNANDRNKRGYLLGVEARSLLMQSGLPQPILAQIWTLSDVDRDGKLTCDEFCIAMHLSDMARLGHVLPSALPAELLPTKARSGSITSPPTVGSQPATPKKADNFGDLLGNMGMSAPSAMPPIPAVAQPAEEAVVDEQVTFEDKRKENFDKGQAELERRRAILREQQQQEANARLEKERQEAEKRERQRLEAENRRQAELQRQLERQREKEREIEEQRRKMVEQRESARRELERSRQMEWERQRKSQLLAEKQKEYEQLSVMKTQMASLKAELESLDGKKSELTLKISQVQAGVTDFTTSIDKMRVSRDRTLADIDVFERQSNELDKKLVLLGKEKEALNVQVQSVQDSPLSDAHRTVMHSVELKKSSIQRLKKEVEQVESDTEAHLGEIDCENAELKNLQDQLAKLQVELPQLQKQQAERKAQQRKMAEEVQQKQNAEKDRQEKLKREVQQQQKSTENKPQTTATSEPNWFDFNSKDAAVSVAGGGASSNAGWDSVFSGSGSGSDNTSSSVWGANGSAPSSGTAKKTKHRAIYDFVATREDELSFTSGQEIWVMDGEVVAGMEDWHKGQLGQATGWFPKAYVEKIEEQSTNLFGSAFEPVVQSSTTQSQQQKDLFSANFSQQPSAIESSAEPAAASEVPSEGLLAKAKYPWKARQESDLTFDKDDVILVTQQEEMRWYGQLNEKSGWFPKAYVKLIGVAPKNESAADTPKINNSTPTPATTSEPTLSLPVPNVPQPDGQESGEYYVAMYTYTSEEPSDLNFNEGDMVFVTSTTGDWWSGAVPDQNRSGMFPANYVKKLDIQPSTSTGSKTTNTNALDSMLGDFAITNQTTPAASTESASKDDPFADLFDPISTSTNAAGPDLFSLSQSSPAVGPASSASLLMPGFTSAGANTPESATLATMRPSSVMEFGNFDSPMSQLSAAATTNRPASTGILLDDNAQTTNQSQPSVKTVTFADPATTDPFASLMDPLGKSGNNFLSNKGGSSSVTKDFGTEDPFKEADGGGVFAKQDSSSSDFDSVFGKAGSLSTDVTSPTHDAFGAFGSDGPKNNESFDSVFGSIGGSSVTTAPSSTVKDPKDSLSGLPDVFAMEKDALRNSPMPSISVDSTSADDPMSLEGVSGFQQPVVGTPSGDALSGLGKKSTPAPPPPVTAAMACSVEDPPSSSSSVGDGDSPEQKSSKKPEIARVIAPYAATGSGQLSLETGNLINVRQKSPRGWWEGELQVRGQKKKIGWFPANYVKLLGSSSARSTPEPTGLSALSVGAQGGSRSATPQSIASQDSVGVVNHADTVVALYAYAAQNDDELTFQKDDVITVLSREGPDWWNGQLGDQKGMFPSNYVTPNPQSQSWQNDTVQQDMTRIERKRQHVIQELISTEESYNADMQTALEVFKKPLLSSNALPADQVNQIFVNWEELIVCNKKLLQALRVRKKMSGQHGVIFIIGDILCESIPHMNPYMRFCSCQLSAAAALQRASENSPSFQEFHRACMQNPKVKGVHLSGYLLKPMQRITRYPLLIEKILGNTPEDHADRSNLEEALGLAQELCNQANQCVKEKQNCDCLEWIQKNVHCDGLAENIVFNSATNCLGPRRLIFSGVVYKAKSNKELVGFLFNDFLMLAQTSRQLGQTFSTLHLFDSMIQFKMYRIPIFLNEVTVKKSSDEAEPCLFQITSDRILNLKAANTLERDMWIKEIEAASKEYNQQAKRKLERAHSVMRTKPIGRVLVVVEEGVRLHSPGDMVLKRPNVGRILVVIQEAAQLKPSDSNGKSDPYCEVSMGAQEHRTKVIAGTLNPKWNASMQFLIRDVERDTLCFTVYDRDLYSPNDFLGRTEVRIQDVLNDNKKRHGPITKRLILHEVETGEVVVKLDLQLFEPDLRN